MTNQSIIKLKSSRPGKTVALFSGVHGNERAGIEAMKEVLNEVNLITGTVYFVFAHPEAIEKNVRYINKNLNRAFVPENEGITTEDKRARELMKVLDKCEALLDLHASNTKEAQRFIICEEPAFELAREMDFGIVSTGWDGIEPGATDGYMYNKGKIALCLECGSTFDYEKNVGLAKKSIYQFLQFFRCIDKKVGNNTKKQRLIHVTRTGIKKTNHFSFSKKYIDFERLDSGSVFATDEQNEYIANKNECIIFPRPDQVIGDEAFIIGTEIDNKEE